MFLERHLQPSAHWSPPSSQISGTRPNYIFLWVILLEVFVVGQVIRAWAFRVHPINYPITTTTFTKIIIANFTCPMTVGTADLDQQEVGVPHSPFTLNWHLPARGIDCHEPMHPQELMTIYASCRWEILWGLLAIVGEEMCITSFLLLCKHKQSDSHRVQYVYELTALNWFDITSSLCLQYWPALCAYVNLVWKSCNRHIKRRGISQ